MSGLLEGFRQWLTEEGRAPKTIESYIGDIKGFQQFIREKSTDESQPLSRFSFVRYKQLLLDKNFAVTTIN